MKSKFKKGLITGLLFYAVGFISAWSAYLIFGWSYKHAPGLHHIIGLLFLLGGAMWTLFYLILILTGLRSKVNFGILTIHLLAIFSFVLFLFIDIRKEDEYKTETAPADLITINKDEKRNASWVINAGGDTLYSKIHDSVLIDKLNIGTGKFR